MNSNRKKNKAKADPSRKKVKNKIKFLERLK